MRTESTRGTAAARLLAGVSALALMQAAPAAATEISTTPPRQVVQADRSYDFDIAAKPLPQAIADFSAVTGLQVLYTERAAFEHTAPPLRGSFTPREALRRLLAGTGLDYRFTSADTVTVERTGSQSGGPARLDTIRIEGQGDFAGQYEVDEGFKPEFQTSATKTPIPIRETPQAVSVITRDSLEARQVQDLGHALETAASVNQYSGPGPFAGMSPFGFNEVQIRGVDLNGALDIREDGFVSPTYWSKPDMVLYERIEAIKGPSSVLYGRGSAGGFVNRVRKKPLAEARSEFTAEVGSFDHYRAEGDVTGPLFDSGQARARLVAAYQDSGSFVDGVESERFVLGPAVEVDITEGTRLLVQGSYQHDSFIPNTGFPLQSDGNDFKAPNISRSLFVGTPTQEENEWEVLTGSAQLEQEITDDWLATLRLMGSRQDSPVDVDSYAYGINANGDVGLYSSAGNFDTDVWSGEFKLDGDVEVAGRPAKLTVGVDHYDFKQHRTDSFAALGTANIYQENFAAFPTVDPVLYRDTVHNNESTGVYTQLQLRPTDRLKLLLGTRYDWATSSYVNNLTEEIDEKDDQAWTNRIGLTYDVHENVTAYGLWAQSFSPSVFASGRDGILEPEEGVTYEAGVKTEWLDGRLGINAAVFRIERTNVPITDPDNGPGEFFSISAGKQRSDGVELEVNGEPITGWKMSFAGSLLDSAYLEQDDPLFGSEPAGTADWQVGMFTSYELQTGQLQGLGAGIGLFAIGDRGISSFQAGGTLPGYERVDLKLFYNGFEPFKAALQVRNVLDEKYVEGADRTGAYAQFGSPRAVLLSVSGRW